MVYSNSQGHNRNLLIKGGILKRTIAIVEDDADQRQNYADALLRRGYQVNTYAGRQDALDAFKSELPDLAILDIMLGDEADGGFDLCREILSKRPGLPIIFLTSRVDDIDRISGLRLGAWDYQSKPVSLDYLAERVSSVFRILDMKQEPPGPEAIEKIAELELDRERIRASWQDQVVDLTYTEFNILQEMIDKIGTRGSSYDALADATRQGVVQNNTINTHILHIRLKFKEIDEGFDCIRSVYGFGYHWTCV